MGKLTRIKSPVWQSIEQATEEASTMVAKIGYFPSAKYPDGTSIAYIASIQEFGVPAKNIPPRPFFRPTMDTQRAVWQQQMGKLATRVMQGKMTVRESFDAIGLNAAGQVRETISALMSPPLKKSTLLARQSRARKGSKYKYLSTKPLVDTGTMRDHLTNITEPK